MKYITSLITAIMMIALLSGCAKSEPAEANSEKENWAPAMVNEPVAHDVNDGQDHSGHNHDAHAGHNH